MSQHNAIKPTELIELALQFQDAWGSPLEAALTFRRTTQGKEEMQLRVKTLVPRDDRPEPVEFTASMQWPTSSHSSVLAALVWLMHNVDQQIDAYNTLAQFGA